MSHAAKRHFLHKWEHWIKGRPMAHGEREQALKELTADVEEMLASSERTWQREQQEQRETIDLVKVRDRLERSLGHLPPGRFDLGEHAHWQGQEIGAALTVVLDYLLGKDRDEEE